MRICIVDDDPLFRHSLRVLLEDLNHTAIAFADGDAAWTHFQTEPAPLVISDWQMPGLDGLALCRAIRRWKEAKAYCYFILLTAHARRDEYQQAMDAGVDDFLSKPVDPQQLFIRVRVANRILTSTARIRRLESLLPMCSYCHRIRDAGDRWLSLEHYLRKHTTADFSHGICPECLATRAPSGD